MPGSTLPSGSAGVTLSIAHVSALLDMACRVILPSKESLHREGSPPPGDLQVGKHEGVGLPWLHRETWWLLLVTACYVVAQPLLFHMHRFLGYDETVYVSQVYPAVPPAVFSPLAPGACPG